ncbi:hypothetical protein VCR4J5_1240022 [Vibrio crassostreae]|uniref:Uncharacterized protein n=1 Tax=Vibrio crassostreae TaxID=246167 RepID=A0ABM9QLD8_9VIBR|nr:hypothetical protein VCR4J5_1240022 [Vibrio crassostreae]
MLYLRPARFVRELHEKCANITPLRSADGVEKKVLAIPKAKG